MGKSFKPKRQCQRHARLRISVIRKHGSPIHFTEVAKQIEKLFKKKAHVATTHNELSKIHDLFSLAAVCMHFLNGVTFLAWSKMSSEKFSSKTAHFQKTKSSKRFSKNATSKKTRSWSISRIQNISRKTKKADTIWYNT
jgi:hypothetical protein